MPKRSVNPHGLFPSVPHGFSQAVVASGKATAYVSGQVAWDSQKRLVGAGDIREQARMAFRNLTTALEACGASLADVVMLRIYVVDYDAAKGEAVGSALHEFFPADPPASSWIGVAGRARPELLIEVEATAALE